MTLPLVLVIADESRDRSAPLRQALESLSVPFQRIEAVFLQSLPPEYSDYLALAYTGRPLSLGEVGCAMSHLKAYQKFLQSNEQFALVFEDDARIGDLASFKAFLASTPSILTSNEPTVISLFSGAVTLRGETRKQAAQCWFEPSHAVAYALTRPAAQQLLDANLPVRFPADWPRGTDITFFVWLPFPVAHGDADSGSLIGARGREFVDSPMRLSDFNRKKLADRLSRYLWIDYFRNRKVFKSPPNYWKIVLNFRFKYHVGRLAGRRVGEMHGITELTLARGPARRLLG